MARENLRKIATPSSIKDNFHWAAQARGESTVQCGRGQGGCATSQKRALASLTVPLLVPGKRSQNGPQGVRALTLIAEGSVFLGGRSTRGRAVWMAHPRPLRALCKTTEHLHLPSELAKLALPCKGQRCFILLCTALPCRCCADCSGCDRVCHFFQGAVVRRAAVSHCSQICGPEAISRLGPG